MTDEDFSIAKQKENLDKLVRNMMETGKDVNEILDMPYNFVLNIMREENKPKYEKDLFAAFGGG